MDFFPTFVHAAGGSTKEITQLEGSDLLPLFQGAPKLERDAIFWHYPHNRDKVKLFMGSTVLSGDWKLYQGYSVLEDALYNLKDDPMEKKNVIKQNPSVEKDLRKKLTDWLSSVNANYPPKQK